MAFPSPGADWPKIDAFLRSKGIRIDTPTLGETEGGGHVAGSEHFQHRARDYPTSTCDAPAIAKALEPFAKGPNHIIDELFYSGTRTWYDSGTYYVPGPNAIEYKNHFSHVHAGIRRGASLPAGTPPKPQPAPPKPPPVAEEDDDLKQSLARRNNGPTVYVTDWKTKRPVQNEAERDALIYLGVIKHDYPADATRENNGYVIVVAPAILDAVPDE